jgi:hypothetical protein
MGRTKELVTRLMEEAVNHPEDLTGYEYHRTLQQEYERKHKPSEPTTTRTDHTV